MPHPQPLVPDEARLRDQLTRARLRGRPISRKTAHELADWMTEAIGPGFKIFLTTGAVTSQLYSELGRLYDLRSDEAEQWLGNLTRFVLEQPLMSTRGRSRNEPDQRSGQ